MGRWAIVEGLATGGQLGDNHGVQERNKEAPDKVSKCAEHRVGWVLKQNE